MCTFENIQILSPISRATLDSDFRSLINMSQIARFMWPTWAHLGSCRPQVGPTLAPWALLSGVLYIYNIWDNFISQDLVEYCHNEQFSASCDPGRTVTVTAAFYGRMQLGRWILITATWDVRQTLQIFWTVDAQDSRLVRSESRMRNWRELINVGLICCNTWRLVIRVRNRHSTDGKVITLHGRVIT